ASVTDQSRMALIASPRIAEPMPLPPFSADRKAHHIARRLSVHYGSIRACRAISPQQIRTNPPFLSLIASISCVSCTNRRSQELGRRPAQQREEFREHHGGCTPDFDAFEMKAGDGHRHAIARASRVDHAVRRHEYVDGRFDNARHLTSGWSQLRP